MQLSDDLPLAGMRVIDFANGFAGPLASMVLGDLGAEVVKIEAIDGGDLTRDLTPPLVLSADFARLCARACQSLGRFPLKDIAEPQEAFTLSIGQHEKAGGERQTLQPRQAAP